jgi:integrase
MKPRKKRTPKYCHHKPTGKGYARFGSSRPTYFPGPYDSPESRQAYHRQLAEFLARGRQPAPTPGAPFTVESLLAAFWPHATTRYQKGGKPTSEISCLRTAFRPLRELFGDRPAAEFGVSDMEALRDAMARRVSTRTGRQWSRRTVNLSLSRVRLLFRWGARKKLVPASVPAEIALAEGVRRGSGQARETPRKKPVPLEHVEAVQAAVRAPVAALMSLQLLTGLRPGQACAMRPELVDRSGPLWRYDVPADKSEHRKDDGDEPVVCWIGPRLQPALSPFLDAAKPGKPVFTTTTGRGYDVDTYRRVIARACARLGVPHWHPHQLRHAHAQAVRDLFGVEHARARLGHKGIKTAEVYSSIDANLAREVAEQMG